ncbi:hypothetical protein ABPG72_006913 [Tetrahymena utriculariae]
MYFCIFNFLTSVLFAFNVYINEGRDLSLVLCLICIIPISIKVGNLIYRSLINQAEYLLLQSINNPNFECRNPNFIDIYLRKLYEKTQFNFKFNHFFKDPETCLTLSALISSESIENKIEDEKEDYIGLSRQTFLVQEFFRDLYKQILKARQKIDKKANIKYCYMSFLIQVYKKRTIAYLEILNEKNDQTRQKSLREKQCLYSILQQAEESFKYEAFMNDHINVLQIIDYDKELKNNQILLEECIKNKKLLLNCMSNNIMDLNLFFKKATQLIQQRKILKAKLYQSCAINNQNNSLKEQIQNYIYFLSMGDVKLKNFYFKSSQNKHTNIQQNAGQNQAAPKIQMYRSERFSIVFITLVKNIGTITGASNNLGTLFDYENHEMIGKNINIIIPSNISTKHQQILNNFLKRGSNNHCFQNFRFILGQNKKGFIIPLMIKLKIDIVGKDDFGISGIFRRVSEKQNFMMISETFNISGISENIYKEVFSQYFTLSEVQQFNVNKLIPLFLGIVTIKNEEDEAYSNSQEETFESFLIINYSKSAHQIFLQKTYSIENDIQQIQLSTSNIYKIVFSLQSHFSYGFRYYNLIINSFNKIKQISEEYAGACSTLVQQLDEIYQTPRQILLNLMNQCLNLKYDDEVSIDKMISNKLAEQNSVFLPLDESYQVQMNQITSKKEIYGNFNPFNQIQQSINNISDDLNDQKPYNYLQTPQINHCESLNQVQANNEEDNTNGIQVNKENANSKSIQQPQNNIKQTCKQLNLRKQKKNLTFADNFTNNYVLNITKSNNTINEEPIEEQESFVQTTKSNKTNGAQSKSLTSQSQVLQKIQETKLALEQNDIQQQQHKYQSGGNKRLQQFAQKLKFCLQNSKNKQSPKIKKSPLSPEKVIKILQQNQKSNSNEFQSPLQNQKPIQFQRKKERRGLIRLLTSRMQENENVVSESDSSHNSARSKTKKNTIMDPSADQHKRNYMHKLTFVSIQKKSSSETDQVSPFSNSPLSSFRQGKQRTIMLKSIQNLLQQQFQNIQKQDDINEENGQSSKSQEELKFSQKYLSLKQIPLTTERDHSQKNFDVFEKDDKEDMLKRIRNSQNFQQETNKANENTNNIQIKIGTLVQQSEKSYKEDMIKSKISSLDFIKNSKIESGTKISKKGSTLMISKNTQKNHMSKQSFEKVQEMQSKNTKFDVYDYDFSSSSSESSASIKNQNRNNETSKLVQQQQTHNFQTNAAILDSRQDNKNPLQAANNILSGSNFVGNIGQFNSAQAIQTLKKDLKYSNETKQQYKKNSKKKFDIKQNIDEDEGTSSQSEQKKRNLIFQRLIMHQINKYQRYLIISAIKLLGFLVLLGIALGTFIIYLDINNQFGKMKKNIDYLGWPMCVKSQIILVLKGEVLLRYLKNNIFNYEKQEIDYYSSTAEHQLKSNYLLLQNLITDQLGKDINEYLIFRDIVNTQVEYTFQNSINTLPYQYNTTMFLQYNIDFINSFLFRISNMLPDRQNDESNVFLNYLNSLDALDIINSNSIDNQNDIKQYLDLQLYFGLFAMITISLFFAISVFPLYAIVSSYSQKVLKIFSTFSHDLLTQMHKHLNQFSKQIKKNKKLLTHHQQQNILLFETTRIEKKRNISDTTDLLKLKIFHVLFSISCFLMIIIYPLLNFSLCQAFVNEQHQNLNLLQILFYTKSLSFENIELNYLISYKKIMPQEYLSLNLTQFEMRGNQLIEKNAKDIDQLQIIVKQQHQFTRRNQDEFFNFVLAILEGNACNVVNQTSQYFNSSSQLNYNNCLQIRNGIFTRGLLLSISDTFNIMPVLASLYKINDPVVFQQLLNAYQKTTSFVDLDNYNVGLSIFIDASQLSCLNNQYFDGSQCQNCNISCLSCDGPTNQNCTGCQSDNVLISKQCVSCDYSCLTCALSSNNCNSCQANRTLQNGICNCNQGYFEDISNKQCSQCHYSCLACNSNSCLQCQTNRNLQGGKCICNDGYFEDLTNFKCSPCDQTCVTCSNSSNTGCISCSNNRFLQGSSCLCNQGFYEDSSSLICIQCHYSCKTCTGGSSNNCVLCQGNRTLGNGICSCNQGFYDDSVQQTCIACHYSCKTCTGGSSNNCVLCQGNRTLGNGICSCNQGFYDDSVQQTCIACHYSCKTCTGGSSNNCVLCQGNRTLGNGICPCNQGFYDDPVQQTCIACHYSCKTCTGGSSNNCILCQDNRTILSGICSCNQGFYEDSSSQICLQCHYSCKTCTGGSSNNCVLCQGNRTLGNGICSCNQGFYDDPVQQTCIACHYSCKTCTGKNLNNCVLCQDNRTILSGICSCNQGSYDDSVQQTCIACHYSCKTCTGGSSNNCALCQGNRTLGNGICPCNQGFYDDPVQQTCIACHYSCKTCTGGSSNNCILCQDNRTILSGICSCNQGFYEDSSSQICLQCHYSCKTCTGGSSNNCVLCQGNRTLGNGICSCNQGFYDDSVQQTCIACHYSCKTCTGGSSNNCVLCQGNRTLGNGICSCNQGFYDDPVQQTCIACHYSCKTCTGKNLNNCVLCQDNRTILSGICSCNQGFYDDTMNQTCVQCHYSCLNCQNGLMSGCNTCKQNRNLVGNGVGICKCNNGFYDDSNALQCLPCDYSCQTCSAGNKGNCISCQVNRTIQNGTCICNDGYFEDLSNKQCSPCNYTCQKCTNSNSCFACNETRYLSNNNQGQCLCLQGYFDDGKSSLCNLCHKKCFNCIGSYENMCTQCNQSKNFIPSDPKAFSFSCLCISNSFYSDSLNSCILCNYRCNTCNGSQQNQCLSCLSSQNRIQKGSSCVCIQGYFEDSQGLCQPCHSSCQNCIGSTKFQCSQCDSTQNRFYNKKYSTCECKSGYYDILLPFQYGILIQQTCFQCDPLCKECNSSKTCFSCINNLKLQSNYQCSCQSGYYFDQNINFCIKCFYTCADCIGPEQTDCLTCKQNMISEPSYVQTISPFNQLYKCSCQENNLIQNCIKCHYSCKSFSCDMNYPNICLECPSNRNAVRIQINGKTNTLCICEDGYYEDKLTLKCMQCSQSCSTCIGPLENDCLSCSQNRQLIKQNSQINGQCLCPSGYLEDENTFQCISCSNTCLECAGNQNFCTACKSNAFLNSLGNCTCKQNYYQALDGNCKKCHYSCSNCIGETQFDCIYCSSNTRSLKILNFQFISGCCQCNNGYFEVGESNCQQCSLPCKTCLNTSDNCLSCFPLEVSNRILVNNKCVCKNFFQENLNGICIQCPYDCSECDSKGGCITCIDNKRTLNTQTKRCACNEGYYESEDRQCQKCSYRCKNCSQNPNICTQCQSNQYLNQNFACTCSDGFYEVIPTQNQINNTPEIKFEICAQCHYTCNTCVNESTCKTCILSKSNVFFNSQTQLCQCYFGYEMKVDKEANNFTCIQQMNFNIESTFFRYTQDKLSQILKILINIFNFSTIFSLLFGQYIVSDIGCQKINQNTILNIVMQYDSKILVNTDKNPFININKDVLPINKNAKFIEELSNIRKHVQRIRLGNNNQYKITQVVYNNTQK